MFRRSFITNLLAFINIPFVTKMSRGRQSYEPIELSEEDAAAIEQDRLTGAARPTIPLKPLRPYEPIGTSKWFMQQQICLGVEQTPDEMDHNVGRSKAIKDRYGIPGIVEYVYYDPKNLKIFRISEEEYKARLSVPLAKFDISLKRKILVNKDEMLAKKIAKYWINEEDALHRGTLVYHHGGIICMPLDTHPDMNLYWGVTELIQINRRIWTFVPCEETFQKVSSVWYHK